MAFSVFKKVEEILTAAKDTDATSLPMNNLSGVESQAVATVLFQAFVISGINIGYLPAGLTTLVDGQEPQTNRIDPSLFSIPPTEDDMVTLVWNDRIGRGVLEFPKQFDIYAMEQIVSRFEANLFDSKYITEVDVRFDDDGPLQPAVALAVPSKQITMLAFDMSAKLALAHGHEGEGLIATVLTNDPPLLIWHKDVHDDVKEKEQLGRQTPPPSRPM